MPKHGAANYETKFGATNCETKFGAANYELCIMNYSEGRDATAVYAPLPGPSPTA